MSKSNADIETNASKKSLIGELQKHQAAEYLPKDCTESKQTQFISQDRKATSKFKECWDTQENENESVKCIDFERDVQELKMLDEPNLDSVADNLSATYIKVIDDLMSTKACLVERGFVQKED